MKAKTTVLMLSLLLIGSIVITSNVFGQSPKLGYVNSQLIMQDYKEAKDAQKKLDDLNAQWEAEGRQLQETLQQLMEDIESQSLLLSEQRKQEKQQEAQNLYAQIQQFQVEKWGQEGEAYQKQREFMAPVIESINAAIKKLGEDEKFDYIFDVVTANIVYVDEKQPDLTDQVIEALNQSVQASDNQ